MDTKDLSDQDDWLSNARRGKSRRQFLARGRGELVRAWQDSPSLRTQWPAR